MFENFLKVNFAVKNPFNRKSIYRVSKTCYRTKRNKSWNYVAKIHFEEGATTAIHKVHGKSWEELERKLQETLRLLQQGVELS